ncbi:hypothetical protein QUF80_18975 [Desulfococcaceae bacterium HSG8]|nr:hypothetical protein [Desulfococcaceae bacterium HSG8]
MFHSVTIHISDSLYQQLERAASLFHQPAERIILDSLNHTLLPLLEDIPEAYQSDVFPLLAMNDDELRHESQQTFPPKHWQEYEQLLERKKTAPLTRDEEFTLERLRREADIVMFRRGYASVLLKRRKDQILYRENTFS